MFVILTDPYNDKIMVNMKQITYIEQKRSFNTGKTTLFINFSSGKSIQVNNTIQEMNKLFSQLEKSS